jgi:hypothetical protein
MVGLLAFSTIVRLLLSQLISAVEKSTADMRYFFLPHSSRSRISDSTLRQPQCMAIDSGATACQVENKNHEAKICTFF